MPNIDPSAGDLIEITVHPIGPTPKDSAAIGLIGKIMTRDKSSKWEIELAGVPPMRGLIDIYKYEWAPELRRWIRRPEEEERPHSLRALPQKTVVR